MCVSISQIQCQESAFVPWGRKKYSLVECDKAKVRFDTKVFSCENPFNKENCQVVLQTAKCTLTTDLLTAGSGRLRLNITFLELHPRG